MRNVKYYLYIFYVGAFLISCSTTKNLNIYTGNTLQMSPVKDSCQISMILNPIEIDEKKSMEEGISGRKIVYRNLEELLSVVAFEENGTASCKICINNEGDVIYSEIIPEETSYKKKRTCSDILKVSLKYKFEADEKAPCVESGKLVFNFNKMPY